MCFSRCLLFQHHCSVGVCGTDGHIHEGEFISTFPVCKRFGLNATSHLTFHQLIPGHEAVGSIVELGKDVKGFAIGDRCVADVGITVRDESYGPFISLMAVSVTSAFTVAGVNLSCVRTSAPAVLARRGVSPNTSPSTSGIFALRLVQGSYHLIARSISYIRSTTSQMKKRLFSNQRHVLFMDSTN
jgi:hypothetical protein